MSHQNTGHIVFDIQLVHTCVCMYVYKMNTIKDQEFAIHLSDSDVRSVEDSGEN